MICRCYGAEEDVGQAHVFSTVSHRQCSWIHESKWDLIRRKLVRCLLEEQDKVLRSYFAQRGGMRRNGRSRHDGDGRKHVGFDVYISQMNAQTVAG
jgi:hypothetical protein